MTQTPIKMPAPPKGVISSLATGFETINARLELILLPLALDLWLWLGPHLSVSPLMPQIEAALRPVYAAAAADPSGRQNLGILQAAIEGFGKTFNIFSMLSTAPLGLPSLMAGRSPILTPLGTPQFWQVDSIPVYLLLMGVFILAGLYLAALYLGGIAQQVRDKRLSWGLLLRQVWGDWARLTALVAMAALVLVVLGLPLVLVTGLASLFSTLLGLVIWVGGLTIMLWVVFYAGFAVHGMLLHRRGLFAALWDSARLVHFNQPFAAGIFVMVVAVNLVLAFVWNIPHDDNWLLLIGVGGHALISTALVAATFVFYQDRYRWWVEFRQALVARAEADTRAASRKA
ncbi:MAG: hypothetical protein ABIN37_08795 [Burkholderiaceae bacterium]